MPPWRSFASSARSLLKGSWPQRLSASGWGSRAVGLRLRTRPFFAKPALASLTSSAPSSRTPAQA
eukprot:11226425-Alexandrium_andersonii.AAC.1